jgi:hypothetical protein
MQRLRHLIASIILAGLGLVLVGNAFVVQAQLDEGRQVLARQALVSPAVEFPNCRFGVGGATTSFSVTALNVGWSMDWAAQLNPPRPNGAEYVQVVTIKPAVGGYVFNPPTSTLQAIVDYNPGATWLIGNEPDSPVQDKLRPEIYAQAYHQLYYLIKQRDPRAQVAAGNIVQPTPLRLQYLDRVLSSYQQSFGERLPADLWSIHSYILREIDPADPQAIPNGPLEVWGAYIPPGITATRGILYTYSQMFDVNIFRQRLLDFRTWMRDRGYGDKPLYITEYGTLFPYPPYDTDYYVDEYGVPMTEARTTAFMTATFTALRQLTDASVGYAADGNRVVQRWLWYSISNQGFGGPLFDPTTFARRPLGDAFAAYTRAISPGVDLLAVRISAEPAAVKDNGQPQTTTLRAVVSNLGNISMTQPLTIAFYAGVPPNGSLLGLKQISTTGLAGCGTQAVVTITWPNLGAGVHPMYFKVDPAATVSELNRANNQAVGRFLVSTYQAYLPILPRN